MAHEIELSRPASLSLRVTTFVGIATTLCLIIVGLIIQQSIERHFAEQDAEELQVVADAVQSSLSNYFSAVDIDRDDGTLDEVLLTTLSGYPGIYLTVVQRNGSTLFSMPGPDLSELVAATTVVEEINSTTLFMWMTNEETFRGAVVSMEIPLQSSNLGAAESFIVAVASTMEFHMSFTSSFNRTLWGIMITASLITIIAAWIAVVQGHAPLRYVSNKIRSVDSNQLNLRLDSGQVPVELAELVSSFNDMIERMEDVFHQLTDYSADIAHELRTPITNITTQTQVVLNQARSNDEYREILYSNLEEYERMAKMVNDLLMLAKTDNGLHKPTFTQVDLCQEIHELFEYFEALSDERKVALRLEGACQLIAGDREMIRRTLNNLVSNAIRHTAENGTVSISLRDAEEEVVISITNPGPDIPPQHLARLFDRFYRADPSRQGEGIGLGLAIAKSIIEIHDGAISVSSNDGITAFAVTLPIVAS